MFLYLQAFYGVTLVEGNSLVIFDEVQMFPQARGLIKYLVADGRYDYIETGSLLSIKQNIDKYETDFEILPEVTKKWTIFRS